MTTDQKQLRILSEHNSDGTHSLPSFFGIGRNRVLNGDMLFDQRKEGGIYTATDPESYTLDNMRVGNHSAGTITARRLATAPPGFQYAIQFAVTTANTSPAAADNVHLEVPLEGYYIRDFQYGTSNAAAVALSFWAASSVAGEYSISLMDGTNTVSYVTSYTLPTNTYKFIKISFPPATIGAAWDVAGGFGLKILFDLGTGSDYSTATTKAWVAQAKWRKTGTVSLIQNAAAAMYISGIQLEVATTPTAFEYVPRDIALLRLQRYYYKTFPTGVAVAQSGGYTGGIGYISQTASSVTGYGIPIRWPVEMAGTPTVTFYNPAAANAKWRNASTSTDSGVAEISVNSNVGGVLYNPQVAADPYGALIFVHLTAIATLGGT